MTDANRETGIREELSRAESALAASMLLADSGFPLDAVSRLHRSLLFRVRALLLTRGLEPKSHEGALRLLSMLMHDETAALSNRIADLIRQSSFST